MPDRRAEIDEPTAVVRRLLEAAAEPGDHPRVMELRGTRPPQYAALDDS